MKDQDSEKQAKVTSTTWEWETPHGLVRLSTETVRKYFCQDATEPELMHFLAVCKYHKINPWLKEAYLIKYGSDPATIVVGKDFYNRRSQEFPTYHGHQAGIILALNDADGRSSIERRIGSFHTVEEQLVGGWAKVFRADREVPVEIEVALEEYIQTKKDGSPNRFWREKPATMIRKVALSQAWREAYPGEFSGTLDEAEIVGTAPVTVEMPKSVTEGEAAGQQAQADPGVEGAAATPPDIPPPSPPVESPRRVLWGLLTAQSKSGKEIIAKLKEMTGGRSGLSELSDHEVSDLIIKLQPKTPATP